MQDNESTKKGEHRCLTPQEIGSMVTLFRKIYDWKQFTLAHEAGVSERTVQRVERGEKGDEESLRKIARALRLAEDAFIDSRYIPTEEELQEMATKVEKESMVANAEKFLSVKDAEVILSAGHGYMVDDRAMPAEMSEEIATFKDLLQDWGDIYSDLSHTEKLNACRSIVGAVQQIEAKGHQAKYGVYTTEDHFRIAVLIFAPASDEHVANLTRLIVPRSFQKMAMQSLRRG
jgi:transcriptional regulator with XRE-family HTH domain